MIQILCACYNIYRGDNMKEKIELKDFLNYQFIGMPKYNEVGDVLAFLVANQNEEDNSYESSIHIYRDGKITQLTTSLKEGYFYWKDNETIIFRNMRDQKDLDKVKNGEDLSVFYSININGGEAVKAFSIPLQVGSVKHLNEDTLLLSVNYNKEYSKAYLLNEDAKKELLQKKKDMEDYHVLTQVPFYFNGQGYVNDDRSVLFLYNLKDESLKCITDENIDVSNIEVSLDGTSIYYSASLFETVSQRKEKIYHYSLETEKTECLLEDVLSIHDFKIMDDHLFIAGAKGDDYGINENAKFYRFDLKTSKLELVYNHDACLGSSVGSDARYIGGSSIKVVAGDYYFISTINNASQIQVFKKDNTLHEVLKLDGSVDSFDMHDDKIALVAMNNGKLQELYIKEEKLSQVSTFNEEVLKGKYVAQYEALSFERDGYTLDGWVLKPKDYDENKSYPAILDIHGGPKTVYGPVFYHEMQVWANMGAFVFFMNPRGSDGHGNEFADIRGKYGTGDYDDLMMFTDLVLEKYPSIDQTKVAVTGGSYGGFMTNWIIGHTDRFVAAASQRSISNWIGFAYSSDIGPYFATDQQGVDNIYDGVEKLWWHSPLKYARDVKTPTLFIHSDEDFRCPYFEGIQMYGALMEQGVPSRLVMFKGENHELSRGGKPKHRVKRLEEITNWIFGYFN